MIPNKATKNTNKYKEKKWNNKNETLKPETATTKKQ